MLHVRNSDISFVEHPVYSICKLKNILIQYFLFLFVTKPNSTCKSHFFSENSTCSVKEAMIGLFLWNTQYILYIKISRSRILLLEVALLLLTQISYEKLTYFGNYWCFIKEAVMLIPYTVFQNCSFLISVFFFWFPITYPNCK